MKIAFFQVKGQRTAVVNVCLIFLLLISSGNIPRMNNDILNAKFTELFVNACSTEAGFIG